MSLLGISPQRGHRSILRKGPFRLSPAQEQQAQLLVLLRKARHTQFGRYYAFDRILRAHDPLRMYHRLVPATDYNNMYERWWSKAHLCDDSDVCWPGKVPYFALSSGTSQAATKYIPVTDSMLKAMKYGSRRLFFDMIKGFNLPLRRFSRPVLMVGSCTQPRREGLHYTGDLSGIIGLNRPLWLEHYYRPGREITDLPEWNQRIERIAAEAPRWDIGFAVGNPMWTQMILQRIIERYGLKHIHEIWPDFSLFIHGGVFFEPYRHAFDQMLGKPVQYVDSYMASEGFFAYQTRPDSPALRLLTNAGIFFEFVPFESDYFDENGDLRTESPLSLSLEEVQEGRTYAMLLSTCAGAWRYLLGDTIQFTDVSQGEFRLTGRTKQFLSVCGEHLSIDNLNDAVQRADARLNAGVQEFAVAGVRKGNAWAHQWYLSMENPAVDPDAFARVVDEELCRLNEDYAIERAYALHEVQVQILPNDVFFGWLGKRGKLNGQAKIPRVLKGEQLLDFQTYIDQMFAVGA